jgi:nuclear pore complex protein Nup160
MSLFSTPPILRIHSTSDALYLIVFIPAPLPSGNFIICYQLHFEGRSTSIHSAGGASLGYIETSWQKRCDEQTRGWNAELRDIMIAPTEEQNWKVWGLWDAAGETLVKQIGAGETETTWSSVSTPQSYSPLHGLPLNEDLKAVMRAEDVANFFMQRIVEAGRFSKGCLEEALGDYEDMLNEREGMLPNAAASTSASDSIRDQIRSIVGSTVKLEEEATTGALLHDAHWSALRKEWVTFVSLVEDQAVKERWPIGFVKGRGQSDEPYIISRGRISLPIEEDRSSLVLRSTHQAPIRDDRLEDSVIEVLSFAKKLFQAIDPAALIDFEARLIEMLEAQSSIPPESFADVLWTSQLQTSIADDESLEEDFALLGDSIKTAIAKALHCIQETSLPVKSSPSYPMTELDAALCSDAITQLSCDRLAVARMLNVLCLAIYSGSLPLDEALDEGMTLEELLGEVTATYQRLYSFDVLARREGTVEIVGVDPTHEDVDEADANAVALEMENMQVGSDAIGNTALATSMNPVNLVHTCILRRRVGAGVVLSGSTPSRRVHDFAIHALQDLLFKEGQNLVPIELTPSLAHLADDVVNSGHPSAAAEFVTLFPRTPASHYILARTELLFNEFESAVIAFEKVVPAFYRLKEEVSEYGSGLMDLVSPSIKRARTTTEALFCYYRRVVSLYQNRPSPSHFHIAHFAKKAIDAAALLSDCNTRALQEARFISLLALEWYEDAYTHLIAIPYSEEQKRLLPDFISRMCEQGQVDGLLSLNFASLQVDVVNTLSFKARNSKSLEEIDFYFDLLYAFYVKRGDFKNAGATMWQMGTLLRQMAQGTRGLESNEEEVRQLSIMEARCYLACINVLSQLDVRDAWFAHDTGGAEEEEGMDSKLTRYVPKSSFFGKARDSLRIVNLGDIQRRYQVRLSQLELFTSRPHYSTSILTTDRNDANNVVSLVTSNDDFERAFTVARLLDIDRSQVYTSLTDRCLDLTRWEQARKQQATEQGFSEHPMMQALLDDQESILDDGGHAGFVNRIDRCTTWTGSASQRAWRYLRLWLTMEEDDILDRQSAVFGSMTKYYLVVLNRILFWNQYSVAPAWLLEWLRLNKQELLIKSLLSHSLLESALNECLDILKKAETALSRKRKHTACQVYLPYLLFDELLKRAEEGDQQSQKQGGDGSTTTSLLKLRTLAKKVRDAVQSYKSHLEKMQAQSIKERDDDHRRQKRYQEHQEVSGKSQVTL